MTRRPAPVISPCIAVCVIDPETELCKGCFRSLDEIGRWMLVDDDGKRKIIADSEARRLAAGKRRPKVRAGRDFVDRSGAGKSRTPDPT